MTRIRIVDQSGRPITDAGLAIVESTVPMPEIALLPNAEGIVELDLPPGRYRIRVHTGAGEVAETSLETPGTDEALVQVIRRR